MTQSSTTQFLRGRELIDADQSSLRARIAKILARRGRPPGLAVIIVGSDPASQIYVSQKQKRAEELGFYHQTISLPADSTPEQVRAQAAALNQDPRIDGILIQRPLPAGFVESQVSRWVSPEKDVDAFHPENLGQLVLGRPAFVSCTPLGIMDLLRYYRIPLAGRTACVVGRSAIVGKPMAALLLNADATVIQCHSKTPDLAQWTLQAEVLIVAAGKPRLIKKEHVRQGAVVIDVGIHRDASGKVFGDVDSEAILGHASALSPVPGGVGPMTIHTLLKNTILSAENSSS